MTLGYRKLIVLSVVAAVFLIGNLWVVVDWLDVHGVIDFARCLRQEYVTGTAMTVILVLLLVWPGSDFPGWLRRCSVCNRVSLGRGRYCSNCGSKSD
jgi:hypothetical protein